MMNDAVHSNAWSFLLCVQVFLVPYFVTVVLPLDAHLCVVGIARLTRPTEPSIKSGFAQIALRRLWRK